MSLKALKEGTVTHLSPEVIAKLRNVSTFDNCLDTGSKNRLSQYRRNLSVTRGIKSRNFDIKVFNLLKKYALNETNMLSDVIYLDHLKDENGIKFSRNYKNYSMISDAIDRFSEPNHTPFYWCANYQKAVKDLTEKVSKLKLKPLLYSCDDDIRAALPKVDTHSGWFWIESGKKKKGENIEGIYNKFQYELSEALKVGSFNKPLLLGFRTQGSGEFDDDGTRTDKCKHKLRVVSMVDLIVIIAELMFAAPFQYYLSSQNYYAGGKNDSDISGIISGWKAKYNKFISIDYSSFDQTISDWLIKSAFSIVKSAFVLEEYESKLFDVIVNDFINKDFILNEGYLHSSKGVPSGSMFTQIIDTLVNWIVIKTYFNHLNENCDMIIMGDDNLIFTNSIIADLSDIKSYVQKNFGLIIDDSDKSLEGNPKRKDPKFLSRFWTNFGPWRCKQQLLSRLLYSERKRNYDNVVGPQHVIYSYILSYRRGMEQLINVGQFLHDYPISKQFVINNVDSHYLPGVMAYLREYSLKEARILNQRSHDSYIFNQLFKLVA